MSPLFAAHVSLASATWLGAEGVSEHPPAAATASAAVRNMLIDRRCHIQILHPTPGRSAKLASLGANIRLYTQRSILVEYSSYRYGFRRRPWSPFSKMCMQQRERFVGATQQ